MMCAIMNNLETGKYVQVDFSTGSRLVGKLVEYYTDEGAIVIDEETNMNTRRYIVNTKNVEAISQIIKKGS